MSEPPAFLVLEDDPGHCLQRSAEVLLGSGVIVFPTDTVYGLLSVVPNPGGYRRIYEIKQRRPDQPLALLAHPETGLALSAGNAIAEFPGLLKAFELGCLTVIADDLDPAVLPAGAAELQSGAVGVRQPVDSATRRLLQELGGAAWATSANPSGAAVCTTGQQLRDWLAAAPCQPQLVVTSSTPRSGQPSRVVSISSGISRELR